ncbi:MAG: UDP-N-acetylmuramoyl-tripeptide--D-alanyl-D-alanine ligase [Candidatus Komeilibacteria bacterium]|nr:UDP-N-acetylmuramoyl-tripeptide--D-alanyl-D-alanine ligase [Candidatus Komeilibacteria bacterium]
MKQTLYILLKFLAQRIVKKYHPDIISITGSVGKTSAKEAIYAVLNEDFTVRASEKNYNNELGVPLTIIGTYSGGRSVVSWARVIKKAFLIWWGNDVNYPRILVLEMGADHPGDIKYLQSFLPNRIGILTSIGEAHLEYFHSLEKVAEEKREVIKHLPAAGWAIINRDNDLAWQQRKHTKAQIVSYGENKDADIRAEAINLLMRGDEVGLNFKVSYRETSVPIFVPNIISHQHISALLAAVAVGLAYNLNLVHISQRLKQYQGAPGRTNLIKGIKNTLIIDDTYNSSPLAAKAAIELLDTLPLNEGGKRYAVLGDMLELGAATEDAHRELGFKVAEHGIDCLLSVGERSRDIARGAREAGMPDDFIFTFSDCHKAGIFLQDRMKEDDIILVKGSQGMRMEKIVKEIMAEPEKATELLVRQQSEWEE